MTYVSFNQDKRTIDAVIRNLEIIGEAANFIPAQVQDQFPDLPWNKMRGIRNILAHEYFGISISIIWQTIQQDLDPLITPLKTILDQNADK
jgi:uncharacterized protein with HEPN domain